VHTRALRQSHSISRTELPNGAVRYVHVLLHRRAPDAQATVAIVNECDNGSEAVAAFANLAQNQPLVRAVLDRLQSGTTSG
jgi:hypothetical protein